MRKTMIQTDTSRTRMAVLSLLVFAAIGLTTSCRNEPFGERSVNAAVALAKRQHKTSGRLVCVEFWVHTTAMVKHADDNVTLFVEEGRLEYAFATHATKWDAQKNAPQILRSGDGQRTQRMLALLAGFGIGTNNARRISESGYRADLSSWPSSKVAQLVLALLHEVHGLEDDKELEYQVTGI